MGCLEGQQQKSVATGGLWGYVSGTAGLFAQRALQLHFYPSPYGGAEIALFYQRAADLLPWIKPAKAGSCLG